MAVYTDVTDAELRRFLSHYDLGALLSFKGIAEGVENSNFIVRTQRGSFILTLYEKRVAEADLPFFLGLMEHLAQRGLSCPLPVKGEDGMVLRRVAGRPAALISFLDGVWTRQPGRLHCAQVGRALAELHLAGEGFALTRPNALSVASWPPLAAMSGARADEVQPGLEALIAAETNVLQGLWPSDLPAGVIHADLFPDNVFFLGDRLSGLIDFYFACNDLFAYDLAICLNAWCFTKDGRLDVDMGRALVENYQAVRPLSEAERSAFPTLARGGALRFLLTRLYDWLVVPEGALVTPKDPLEYLAKLRFHQGIAAAGQYGIGL